MRTWRWRPGILALVMTSACATTSESGSDSKELPPTAAPEQAVTPAAEPTPPPPPSTGWLSMDTEPKVEVTVQGKNLGTTPLTHVPLEPGEYLLELTNADADVRETRRVTINPGKETRLLIRLGAASRATP